MQSKDQRGFTILEVLIAVVILAAALLPILGLQSSALDRVARNEEEQQAVLIARQILAFIEGSEDTLTTTRAQKRALNLLQELATSAKGVDYAPANADALRNYNASLIVEPWNIELLGDTALQRIVLEISWSPDPRDRVQFAYLVPSQ